MRTRPLVLVCGGRDYNKPSVLNRVLDTQLKQTPDMMVLQGGAPGADRLAKLWCHSRGVPCVEVAAHWAELGTAAGHTRNGWLLDLGPDMVIAFPGGAGTANTRKQAESRGIPVFYL